MMGILVMPIFSLFLSSAGNILVSRQETEAATLAQEGMEILKGQGYAAFKDLPQGKENTYRQEVAGGYSRVMKVEAVSLADLFPGAEGKVIFLEVFVSWGKPENPRTVSLISYLGEGYKVKTGSTNKEPEGLEKGVGEGTRYHPGGGRPGCSNFQPAADNLTDFLLQ